MGKRHVIYIHGFGDQYSDGQASILKAWRLWGVVGHLLRVGWSDNEDYQPKHDRLLKLVDRLVAEGQAISLVGVSAGASMAMNVYAERRDKIKRVVFISGKLLYPETVQESYFQKHPAFKDSVFKGDANFQKMSAADKSKMLTVYALADNTVPVRASKLPGVKQKRILALGHIPAIYTAITFYSYSIAKFLKS